MYMMKKVKMLLAVLLSTAMLLCSFPVVFAGELVEEVPSEEKMAEVIPAAEEEPEPEPAPAPEAEPAPEPEPEPEPEPAPVPEAEPAPEPKPEPAPVPEAEPAPEPEPEPAPAPEAKPAPEPEPEPAPAPEAEPAPEPEPEPAPVPEAEPAPEPVETEKAPAAEPAADEAPETVSEKETEPVTEEEPAQEPSEEAPEAAPEADPEETSGEELFELDDDDPGTVSEELLESFNNPEEAKFDGSVEIEMKDGKLAFGEDVTLVARVSGAETLSYRLVWEANSGDDLGWHAVGSGPEYTFTLTRENAGNEYRIVIFALD